MGKHASILVAGMSSLATHQYSQCAWVRVGLGYSLCTWVRVELGHSLYTGVRVGLRYSLCRVRVRAGLDSH